MRLVLALILMAVPLSTLPLASADTCVGGTTACLMERDDGSNPCPGDDHDYHTRGVRVLGGGAEVSRQARCSDADTYHQEGETYRVSVGVPGRTSITYFEGNGSTHDGGPNEGRSLTVTSYNFLGAYYFLTVRYHEYENDLRDDCEASVSFTSIAGSEQTSHACAEQLPHVLP